MNLVSIAIVLGSHPLSVLERGEELVREINVIFPEGQVTITTTGDELHRCFSELTPVRQQEIGCVYLTTPEQAARMAQNILKISIEENQVVESAGVVAAIILIMAFLAALVLAIYVYGEGNIFHKGAVAVLSRRQGYSVVDPVSIS